MELGTIRRVNIDSEMQASYLDYAMSVIVSRALPDVRDGLKPVHRRILYAMHDLGLTNDKPYKKSARIVGEVLGKYHPHGDAAVYEAMVRMAQDFSLRYRLVDGQGNFGSIDGDNAAAMRYTEARLSAISAEMLADIDLDTVDWTDNFDSTLREPTVLPGALPNLLINGASGIAVGMATNIPPHNLGEVCDALGYLIDNYRRVDEIGTEDLTQFVHGPDFPTGGVIYRYQEEGSGAQAERVDIIERSYASGRGSIVVQAKAHIEEMSRSKSRIVITELPYQTDKTRLLERIAELVRDGRLEGITDLRDESDRTGMRINIELTRTVDPRLVLADLFKLTPLQTTFGVSLLALVDGQPVLLSLKRILLHYIEHRQAVIVRRSNYDLARARQRAHVLEGLLRALDILDEVIALIRKSRTADTARTNLMREFKFTELQAQAILEMQLRRLAALEREKLREEQKQIAALIRRLEELLASPEKVLALIRDDVARLKARYGDVRRTQIADRVRATLTIHDMLPDQEVWISMAGDGTLARRPAEQEGGELTQSAAQDAARVLLRAHARADLYLFTADGQAVRVQAHQIPESPGAPCLDIAGLRQPPVAIRLFYRQETVEDAPGYLLLGTALGKVKRLSLADLLGQGHTNPQVINMDAGDRLVWVDVSRGGGDILMLTSDGQAIRFGEDEVRPMGLAAGGVGGIKLRSADRVISGMAVGRDGGEESDGQSPAAQGQAGLLALLTEHGSGKRVPLSEFPMQGRNGLGVVAAKPSERSGALIGACLGQDHGCLICLMASGRALLLPVADLPRLGRLAQGKPALPLPTGDAILRAYAAPLAPEREKGGTRAGRSRKPSSSGGVPSGGEAAPGRPTAQKGTGKPAGPAKSKSEPATDQALAGEPVAQLSLPAGAKKASKKTAEVPAESGSAGASGKGTLRPDPRPSARSGAEAAAVPLSRKTVSGAASAADAKGAAEGRLRTGQQVTKQPTTPAGGSGTAAVKDGRAGASAPSGTPAGNSQDGAAHAPRRGRAAEKASTPLAKGSLQTNTRPAAKELPDAWKLFPDEAEDGEASE